MKRGSKAKLRGFLTRMRLERLRLIKRGHHARAIQIKHWLIAHADLIKDAA